MSTESETERLKRQNKAEKELRKQQRIADGLEKDRRRRKRKSDCQDVADYARSKGVYVIAFNSKSDCKNHSKNKCQCRQKTAQKKSARKKVAEKNLAPTYLVAEPVITYVNGNKATTVYNLKGVRR